MPLMKWNKRYSARGKSIDSQHTILFGLINDLHDRMLIGQGNKITGSLLKRLADYTRTHSAAEEKMMEARTTQDWLGTKRSIAISSKRSKATAVFSVFVFHVVDSSIRNGIRLSLFPVAAKIAFATAGPVNATAASPSPCGSSWLSTIQVSNFGVSGIRNTL